MEDGEAEQVGQNKRQRVQQEDDTERTEQEEITCDGVGWPTFPPGHQVISIQT
jgi:hypothetical protein